MVNLSGPTVRRLASWTGLPEGTGELIDQPTRVRLIVSMAGSLVLAGLDMLGVLIMLPLLQIVAGQDRGTGALGVVYRLLGEPGDSLLIGAIAGALVLCFVGKDICALYFRRWQMRFMAHQELSLSVRMLHYYLDGPYLWQLAKNTGDKVWTINAAVAAGYSGSLGSALSVVTEGLTILFILASLAFVSPTVTVAAAVYFGVAALVIQRFVRPRVVDASRRNQEAGIATSQVSLQALGSAKEVKLRNAGELFVDDYRRSKVNAAEASVAASFFGELPRYLMEILFIIGIGLLAFGIATTGSAGESLVLLGVFAAGGSRIMTSFVRLMTAVNGIRYSREPLKHLIRERRTLDVAQQEAARRVLTDRIPAGTLEVSDLHFSYPMRPDQSVLSGIDLTVREGESIAFVGTSGAGKSTLVDLLLGLLTPTSGVIRAGGIDIQDNLPGWQRHLAVVPQDVVLFDDSLRANIVFEMKDDAARLEDVVRRAQLTQLVSELPEGLDSPVGERGTRLSGGQRQRIGIARALYREPSVLFLDEATSALDNETERRLSETIDGLKGSMTIIIVAHRLSTIRNCDRIVFMSGGRVAGVGTFDEVAEQNEEFATLVRLGSLTTDPATAGEAAIADVAQHQTPTH